GPRAVRPLARLGAQRADGPVDGQGAQRGGDPGEAEECEAEGPHARQPGVPCPPLDGVGRGPAHAVRAAAPGAGPLGAVVSAESAAVAARLAAAPPAAPLGGGVLRAVPFAVAPLAGGGGVGTARETGTPRPFRTVLGRRSEGVVVRGVA